MRESFLERVRCPACHAERSFALEAAARDEREVRDGTLACRSCGHEAQVRDGIVDLMHDPPDFVMREAAGLERFADLMRSDGWDRERIMRLPYEDQGYWFAQATAMEQVLQTVELDPGATLLDVGANTCWASAIFAERGLEVIALDIAAHEMQGLRTADWWFEEKEIYFERLLSPMFATAIASDSLDFVFCCEVLHHNHRGNLHRTLRELFRVLKPGGKLLVVNETLRSLRRPLLRPGKEVAEFEGHEHAFVRRTYVSAARRAGFGVQIVCPWLHGICRDERWTLGLETPVSSGLRMALANAVRRSSRARRAFLGYKAYLAGETSLHMVATKPG